MPCCRVRYGQAFIWFAGARVRRSLLLKGDVSSAGGVVLDGEETSKHYDTPLTYIGARVHCPACKSEGVIAARGPRWPHSIVGKEQALEGDICVCKCQPFPVMVASQFTSYEEFDEYHLGQMGFNADGTRTPPLASLKEAQDDQPSTLVDHPELICPNMTNEAFAAKVTELCGRLVKLTQTRLGELQRWNSQDQHDVVTWFGVADTTTRQTLLDGLTNMLRVFKSLTPANFIRWSETALTNVGCAPGRPKGETRDVVAAVCKPDTKTHTISIALRFCEMRDYDDRKDSRLLTLAHEVSHFLDTMDTADDYYTIWNSVALAKIKSPKCITIADSVAGYIVIHTTFPPNFGNFINQR